MGSELLLIPLLVSLDLVPNKPIYIFNECDMPNQLQVYLVELKILELLGHHVDSNLNFASFARAQSLNFICVG